jgi:hypothetical protein
MVFCAISEGCLDDLPFIVIAGGIGGTAAALALDFHQSLTSRSIAEECRAAEKGDELPHPLSPE